MAIMNLQAKTSEEIQISYSLDLHLNTPGSSYRSCNAAGVVITLKPASWKQVPDKVLVSLVHVQGNEERRRYFTYLEKNDSGEFVGKMNESLQTMWSGCGERRLYIQYFEFVLIHDTFHDTLVDPISSSYFFQTCFGYTEDTYSNKIKRNT